MNCGDVIYRSTLDSKLRGEETAVSWEAALLLLSVLGYLSVTPGAGAGFLDYYLLAPLARSRQPVRSLDDYALTEKLGEGGFGTVWRATELETGEEVVMKCATGFGEEERWMNERASRSCPGQTAAFLSSFRDARRPQLPRTAATAASALERFLGGGGGQQRGGEDERRGEPPLWLVWKLEGTRTLADWMMERDFPYCLETAVFGAPLEGPKGPARAAQTVRRLTRDILTCLASLHGTGIVHRDVKPENLVLARADQPGRAQLLLIDLGAAADLRVGVNYAPRLFLLDPRYAAPEQYIMSTQTPQAPPVPLALLLSPTLWQLNSPDRFDTYAVGLILLQMALPALRPDRGLTALRKALEKGEQPLEAWRDAFEKRPEQAEAFELLDADAGAGWELVRRLVRNPPSRRLSAARALRHRFVTGPEAGGGQWPLLAAAGRALDSALSEGGEAVGEGAAAPQTGWLMRRITRPGITEAQMEKLGELQRTPTVREAATILKDKASGLFVTQTGGEEPQQALNAYKMGKQQARKKVPLPEDAPTAASAIRDLGEGGLRGLLQLARLDLWGATPREKS